MRTTAVVLLALGACTSSQLQPERGPATLLVVNSGLELIRVYGPAGLMGQVLPSKSRCFRLASARMYLAVRGPFWRYRGPSFDPAGGGWVWEIGTTPFYDVPLNLIPAEKCEP